MRSRVVLDDDVQAVLEFMQRRVAAQKLVGVARAVADVAPILWGHFDADAVRCLGLQCPPISVSDPRSDASEFSPGHTCAGGDSAEAGDNLAPMSR